MQRNKTISVIMLSLVSMFILSTGISAVSATTCADAGDFTSVCGLIANITNATVAIVSVILTGDNATTIIYAIIVLAIVMFFYDLARGENSYVKKMFRK